MNRRSVLAVLGSAGAAGVSGYWLFGEHARHGATRTVSLTGQDDVPDWYGVDITVDVLGDEITASRTARLRVTTTNTGSTRALSVGPTDTCHMFNRSRGGSDDPAGLWLYETGQAEDIDRDGTRWVPDTTGPRGFPGAACLAAAYESGRQRSTEYELWDDYRVDGYLEPGTYRWERAVDIWDDPDVSAGDSPDDSFTWGFEITLETRA